MIIYTSVVLFIILTGYFGIQQTSVFASPAKDKISKKKSRLKRYQRSGLKDKDADTIKKVLISAMEDEKYYLEPELTLTQLAKYTNVSTNNLSQVINEHLHSSFCYFVNSYRVKAFIDSISDIAEKRRQYFLSHFVAVSIQNRHLTPHLKNTQARHLLNF